MARPKPLPSRLAEVGGGLKRSKRMVEETLPESLRPSSRDVQLDAAVSAPCAARP